MRRLGRSRIPNGYARRHGCTAKDVDPAQLKIGMEVEMEHTSDPKIAREIALDHICENKGRPYYIPAGVRHEQLLLKRRGGFGAVGGTSCSTSPRWVRGGIGLLLGGVLGGMIGGGIAMVMVNSASITEPLQSAIRLKTATMLPIFGALVGGAGVGIFAAAKPECT